MLTDKSLQASCVDAACVFRFVRFYIVQPNGVSSPTNRHTNKRTIVMSRPNLKACFVPTLPTCQRIRQHHQVIQHIKRFAAMDASALPLLGCPHSRKEVLPQAGFAARNKTCTDNRKGPQNHKPHPRTRVARNTMQLSALAVVVATALQFVRNLL